MCENTRLTQEFYIDQEIPYQCRAPRHKSYEKRNNKNAIPKAHCTFGECNSRGASIDGVEDSFVADLRLGYQADLGAQVGNALALRSHPDSLWKIPRLTALLVEPAPNMVASQSHAGSCSLPTEVVLSGV